MNVRSSRAVRLLLGFAALFGAAGSAYANGNVINLGSNNVWTVYAFGNAQAVADAFRALTNFAASGTFQSIVGLIAVLGVLGVGLSGGFNPAMAKRFIGYVVGVFLVCYVFFGVTNNGPLVVNVEVIDTVDMTWKAPVTVPAVVGIPAAIISTAGYRITEAIEASFQLPTQLKMSQGAPFNLAAAMIADASQARITDSNLASSLAYYVQDCFTIGVAQGALRADTLLTSTDFLTDIRFASDAVMVNTLLQDPVGTPGIVSCSQAWQLISDAVNKQGSTAADFLKDASAWSKTPAMSVVNSAADSLAQWATNSGITDGAALVKQSAILTAFRGAYSQAANQTGNSDFLTGIAMTQATESQRTSWITGAEIFNKTMGYIFAILQVFVYAITPLVLCAALVPGLGIALLKNFAQILLWLAIWQPMLAIVNFIVLSMQQSDLGGILSNGAAGYGFTLNNMGIVSEKAATLRAAASMVGTMVPALAWAMVKGSVDFSRVIGSAVGENFAQGAANTMTTGNYSLNQASMDSFTANKHSTAATGAWGEGHTNAGSVGARTSDLGGSKLPTVGEQSMNVSSTSGIGTNKGGNYGDSAQAGRSASNMNSATASAGTSSGTSSVESGGVTDSSAGITSATGQIGLSGGVAVIKPGGGGGPASNGQNIVGTNVPSAQGGQGAAQQGAQQPGQMGSKQGGVTDRVRADANGSENLTGTGQHSKVNNHSNVDSKSHSATQSHMGSNTKSGGESASYNKTAGHNNGWVENENMQVTGISPEFARAQAAAAYMTDRSTDWLTGRLGYGQARSSQVGDTVHKLNTDGAIQHDVKAEKTKTNDEVGHLKARETTLESGANAAKRAAEGGATTEMGKGDAAVKATEAPAKVGALARQAELVKDGVVEGKDAVIEKGKEAIAGAKEAFAHAKEAMTGHKQPDGHDPKHTADKGAHTPTQAVMPGQGGKQPDSHDHKQPAQAASATQAPAGQQHQPDNRGQQTPGSADKGHHAPTQAAAGQHKPEQHGDNGQPKQVAMNDPRQQPGERDQDREREQQARQLAAAASIAALQAAAQPPQAQANPQLPAPPEAPTQLAQAQQPQQHMPDTQGQHATPNPFSGEKVADNSSQLQGQVQMAEQRAERLDNQRRAADGVLASAEGRKASELPELINQARDLTRNA